MKQNMNSEQIQYILTKLLFKREMNEKEIRDLHNWRNKDQRNEALYHFLDKDMLLKEPESFEHMKRNIWSEIEKQINIREVGDKKEIPVYTQFRKRILFGFKYAAIFLGAGLLPCSLWYYTQKPVFAEIIVPYGDTSDVTLPDGSCVKINSGSKLTYTEGFWKRERKVMLDGEAFFNVKKKNGKPFIVYSKGTSVRVLGTSFNIKSYLEDPWVETTLHTGSVAFAAADKNINLKPNQKLTYHVSSGSLTLKTVKTTEPDWTQGIYKLENSSLREISKLLKNIYGVTVILPDSGFDNLYFSGYIDKNKSLEDNLEIICLSTETTYTKNKNIIHMAYLD
ncbi:MAG: FecR domain-containing protein [Bacteroidales bacterium]